LYVEDLQQEVLKTTCSIENLQKVLENYEKEIKCM
jgi:bacterioferritin (cytochrome b1)